MYTLAKLQARGQMTLPKVVRDAVKLKPGDSLRCIVDGPTTIRLEVFPKLTLAEMIERYSIDEPYDEEKLRLEWQAEAADEEMRHS